MSYLNFFLYFFLLLKDILFSTISSIKYIFSLKKEEIQKRRGELSIIKISRHDINDNQSIILGGYITLTPGTYTVKITKDHIFVSVLQIENIKEIKQEIILLKNRLFNLDQKSSD